MTIPIGVLVCWTLLMAFFVLSGCVMAAHLIHEHFQREDQP